MAKSERDGLMMSGAPPYLSFRVALPPPVKNWTRAEPVLSAYAPSPKPSEGGLQGLTRSRIKCGRGYVVAA